MVRDAVSSKRVSSDYSLFFANLQRNIISRRYSGTIPSIKPGDYETLGPDFPDVRQQSINKAVSGPYQRSKLGLTGAAALTIARLQETPKNQEFCSAVTGWGGGLPKIEENAERVILPSVSSTRLQKHLERPP